MARKNLGFVSLIWECSYCKTQNPGPIKTCTSCGAPQPDDVEFLRVDEEKFNFIKDEALIRMAQAGPDIHCPYCGTRNPAGAELCSNCGGEINIKGKVVRDTGKEVRTVSEAEQELQEIPTPKPSVTPISTPRKKPSRMVKILGALGILAVIAGCIILLMLFLKTDTVEATVTKGAWERSVAIEAFRTVTDSGWWDEIPDSAEIQSCTQRYRYTSDSPEPNATEVCSDPIVEDTGTGIGEVVQECVYEVYDDYCDYTYMNWVVVSTAVEKGEDWNPVWPKPNLNADQQLGTTTESYTIVFTGDGETYTYTTSDPETYMMAQPGTLWELSVNQLGGIQSIEPAN
jgi:hypothetical protein